MATLKTITAQLMTLNQVYQRNIANEALAAIASAWMEDLRGLSDEQLCRAVALHRSRSVYWPGPAHILQAASDLTPNRPPFAPVLPTGAPRGKWETLYPELVAANVKTPGFHHMLHEFFESRSEARREEIARQVLGDARFDTIMSGATQHRTQGRTA